MPLKLIFSLIFLLQAKLGYAHGVDPATQASMQDGGFLEFLYIGAEHMLTGYDHLLFLFGVIFFLKSFKQIIMCVSAFTLGHSLTLIGATFMGISANYWLIDAIIALTVCYKGFDNNNGFEKRYGFKKAPPVMVMIFIFGLIHGFGLSTRLQQLPLDRDNLLTNIISFNIGVELGQIIALGIMVIFLSLFRERDFFKKISKLLNDGLIFCGILLFLMQMHGYFHNNYIEDFGFNHEEHFHHHEEIEQKSNQFIKKLQGDGHNHDGHHHDH
jgi:hypothetical protein